jgi:hypothetical protein
MAGDQSQQQHPQQQQQQEQQEQQEQRHPADAQLEALAWQRCQLAADAARRALPVAPPAAAREALLRALRRFPGSVPLLQLLVAHEAAGHTLTQLRRELHAVLELRPSPQVSGLPPLHVLTLAMLPLSCYLQCPGWQSSCSLQSAAAWPSHIPLPPALQVLLAMVAVEVISHSPGAVVQAALERAVASESGRSCPLLWRCYLRFEAHRGRYDAVRR